MTNLCKAEKDFCIKRLAEYDAYIPFHYVEKIQERAKEKGIDIPHESKIRNVRNKRQFDKDIVDLFIEVAKNIKESLYTHYQITDQDIEI